MGTKAEQNGLKIRNIKAGTLFGYNQKVRDRYDYTNAVFNDSLFSRFIIKNGLNIHKKTSTRDIICLEFDFGSRSYEEEITHLNEMISEEGATKESIDRLNNIIEKAKLKKDNYVKKSKEEIREEFYEYGVVVEYITRNKKEEIIEKEIIRYRMLYRSSAKAKIGQVMFINEKLYDVAYEWLTMGLGNKMPVDDALIVEMSAYAPLTTSTIIDTIQIPMESILILKDQESEFLTKAKVVRSESYYKEVKVVNEERTAKNKQKAIENGKFLEDGTPKFNKSYDKVNKEFKKCVVFDEDYNVKNTLWDGMGIIEDSFLPKWVNGMALLRHHFFKMDGFRGKIQLFLQEWCDEHGLDYETATITDMFGIKHKMKDIKVITTDNAIKWKKFKDLMGKTDKEAYEYWCKRVKKDKCLFGIVKTDHESKLGDVQQMSYQMVNTLPCTKEQIKAISQTSVDYVEKLKQDNDEFEKFLRKNANEINHYEMMADLYKHNREFSNSTWFRSEKSAVIKNYTNKLRKGKITVNGDNLTVCGNPYALLMYAVGEDWNNDPTLNYEDGTVQCYTTRFEDGEYLCAIRNPQNSPNNICYLHNHYSPEMAKYFPFTSNIIAVNCIKSDIQSRANGMDFDLTYWVSVQKCA